jgi:cytochrome c-type biogenesis protein CcmH
MKRVIAIALFGFCALLATPVLGVAIDPESLADPQLEHRAQTIMKDLRCLVCQNQSIELSNAGLAHDLRNVVREQVVAGRTDEDIKSFVVDRYGDWVLLKPPFKTATYLLWIFPLLVFAIAVVAVVTVTRRRRNDMAVAPLSPEDEQKVAELLKERGIS